MQRYILRRFFQSMLALLALSMLIFLMSRLTGDPTMIAERLPYSFQSPVHLYACAGT
jgi:ABC-type dipeptide/oligopeptide/nickel transport system permease component